MGDPDKSWETDREIHGRRVIFTRRFVFPLSTASRDPMWTKLLADDATAEAHCDRMGAGARLELRKQVPHV